MPQNYFGDKALAKVVLKGVSLIWLPGYEIIRISFFRWKD